MGGAGEGGGPGMLVDQKVVELAERFSPRYFNDQDVRGLAEHIQSQIEDYLDKHRIGAVVVLPSRKDDE